MRNCLIAGAALAALLVSVPTQAADNSCADVDCPVGQHVKFGLTDSPDFFICLTEKYSEFFINCVMTTAIGDPFPECKDEKVVDHIWASSHCREVKDKDAVYVVVQNQGGATPNIQVSPVANPKKLYWTSSLTLAPVSDR